jgi:hypothetical protein
MLLRLITQHPDATRDELEAMYLAKTKRVPALVDEALRRAFDNDLARVQQPARPRQPVSAEAAAAAERLQNIVLLDLVQPNGKKLGDCTGRECRQMGGVWKASLTKIADRIGDRAVVRRTLSETQVGRIFASGTRSVSAGAATASVR